MTMNPVDKYAYLLSGLTCSEARDHAIVKKIKKMHSEKKAIAFFEKATRPPSISRWIFYPEDARRKAICEMQNYLKEIGVEFPAPSRSVQRFLNGGRDPAKGK